MQVVKALGQEHRLEIPESYLEGRLWSGKEANKHMIERILVALDGSDYSEQSLPYAKSVARGREMEIILGRAPALPEPVLESVLIEPEYRARYIETVKAAITEYLDKLREELLKEGFKVRTLLLEGSPAEAILEAASREKVDLLVMSTRGEHAPRDRQFGSVAERVHRTARCACLLVPVTLEDDQADEED